ncbi:MAG: protein kinase [Planctomycetota bacterium]
MVGPRRLGPYELLAQLAVGGTATVFRTRHPQLGTPLALKVPRLHGADEARLRRFRREVHALGRLDHPHLVRVVDAGEDAGQPYMVMALVEGETLEARLERGPLPVAQAVELGLQVADGLAAAHAQGVLHRDLKPSNLVLAARGAVVVDFGLTRDEEVAESLTLSRSGVILGTPGYWSPEQAGGQPAGAASDIYSLGATLYAALTGQPPAGGASFLEAVIATRELRPTAPRALRPEVPAALEQVVLRCLEKEPVARFPSMGALREALLALQGDSRRRPRRRGAVVAAVGIFLALLAAASGAGFALARRGLADAELAEARARGEAPGLGPAGTPRPSASPVAQRARPGATPAEVTPDPAPQASQSPAAAEEPGAQEVEALPLATWQARAREPRAYDPGLVAAARAGIRRAAEGSGEGADPLRLELADYLRRRGRHQAALAACEGLDPEGPEGPRGQRLRARLLDLLGRVDEAEAERARILCEGSPDQGLYFGALAELYHRWWSEEMVATCAERLRRVDPRDVRALALLARWGRASREQLSVLEGARDDPEALLALALARRDLASLTAARHLCAGGDLVEIDLTEAAVTLALQGTPGAGPEALRAAIERCDEALRVRESALAVGLRAQLRWLAGDRGGARQDAARAWQAPDGVALWASVCRDPRRTLVEAGLPGGAIPYPRAPDQLGFLRRRARGLAPMARLALVRAVAGDVGWDRLATDFAIALRAQPRDPALVLLWLEVCVGRDQSREAERAYRRCVQLGVEPAARDLHWGLALLRAGALRQAEEVLTRASHGQGRSARIAEAELALLRGEPEETVRLLLPLTPGEGQDDPHIWTPMAWACLERLPRAAEQLDWAAGRAARLGGAFDARALLVEAAYLACNVDHFAGTNEERLRRSREFNDAATVAGRGSPWVSTTQARLTLHPGMTPEELSTVARLLDRVDALQPGRPDALLLRGLCAGSAEEARARLRAACGERPRPPLPLGWRALLQERFGADAPGLIALVTGR